MVTITCAKTGVTFDADSRRQKNHPLVSRFLDECARNKRNPGAYNMALAAFAKTKADGMTDINEIMAFAERYVAEGGDFQRQQRNERQAAQAAAEKALEEKRQRIKEERRQRNEFLKAHGYRWNKEFADFDEYEEGEPSVWVLRASDGRQVDVAQAMDEIERGADVVLAEIAEREAAQAEREAEAQRAEAEDRNRHEAAMAKVRLLGQRCEPFDREVLPVIYERSEFSAGTHIVKVYFGEIDGVKHGVLYEYWGGHDWTEFVEFWCEECMSNYRELKGENMTDEEYRSLEQMYERKATEAERLTAILEKVSQAVGPVWSPSIILNGMAEAGGWLPHTPYYDRQGAAGIVFAGTVFEHREIATRFDACRKRLDTVAKRHNDAQRDGDAADPAFEIIRHLKNNWWGRRPVVEESYPNAFADELMERYPAPAVTDAPPKMVVANGKVYELAEFRQYSDGEAIALKDSAYIEADDWEIISDAADHPHNVVFTLQDWIKKPDNVKGTDGKWYLVQYKPAMDW